MIDWLPIEPVLDFAFRHGSNYLPESIRADLLLYARINTTIVSAQFIWSVYRWERQKMFGMARDAKDREQDFRISYLEANSNQQTMAEYIQSPNYEKWRRLRKIRYVVVHSMAGTMQGTINEFLKPSREASAHYLIGHDGREVQMVQEQDTAWHAGYWLRPFTNQDSIGIEHEGGTYGGQTIMLGDAGYTASAKRIARIHFVYQLGEPRSDTVRPHRSMAPTACPSGLDVQRLIQMSLDEYRSIVNPVVAVPVPEPPVVFQVPILLEGRTTKALNVREDANTSRKELRTMQKGQGFWYKKAVPGEDIGGNSTWLLLEDDHYVWSGATNYKSK